MNTDLKIVFNRIQVWRKMNSNELSIIYLFIYFNIFLFKVF